PPLQRDARLDAVLAAIAERDGVPVVLPLLELVALAAPVEDPRPGLLLRQPFEPLRSDETVRPDAARLGQAVVAPDLEIGRIVPRRDLQRSGAELALGALVGDHRHQPLH